MQRMTDEARKQTEKNVPLAYYIAGSYLGLGIDHDEIISCALFGLTKAAAAFNPTRGAKFATFATRCIHNEIRMFLRKWKPKLANEISLFSVAHRDDNDGGDLLLEGVIEDTSADFVEALILEEQRAELRAALNRLSNRERLVISRRYGLDGGEGMRQIDIADEIGCTQSYTSRIEKCALGRLKEVMQTA